MPFQVRAARVSCRRLARAWSSSTRALARWQVSFRSLRLPRLAAPNRSASAVGSALAASATASACWADSVPVSDGLVGGGQLGQLLGSLHLRLGPDRVVVPDWRAIQSAALRSPSACQARDSSTLRARRRLAPAARRSMRSKQDQRRGCLGQLDQIGVQIGAERSQVGLQRPCLLAHLTGCEHMFDYRWRSARHARAPSRFFSATTTAQAPTSCDGACERASNVSS